MQAKTRLTKSPSKNRHHGGVLASAVAELGMVGNASDFASIANETEGRAAQPVLLGLLAIKDLAYASHQSRSDL